MTDDEMHFDDENVQAPEVLNNVMDTKNISMKTRVNMRHIHAISKHFYKELVDNRKALKMTARQCFNETFQLIQQLFCSRDDKTNRTVLVKEALQGMSVMKNENNGMTPAIQMK